MIPNTFTDWFDWFGLAVGNFQDRQVTVTLAAYKDGSLIATSEKIIGSHEKWVGTSTSIWDGVSYSEVDMVLIHSQEPIPAPVSITGNNDQNRHVFFSGQVFSP